MSLKVYLTQEVRDSSGKRVFYKKRRSHSFVLQFLDILACKMNHAYNVAGANENVTDTSNAAQTMAAHTSNAQKIDWATEAPGGTTTYGIVVGTGTNAEAVTNYALQTLIAEGAGAGQMNYGGTAVTTATAGGSITSFTIVRAMANNSGNTITVQETGVVISAGESTGGTQKYFLIVRDLTGATAVNNGQTYTVTYTIQTSV